MQVLPTLKVFSVQGWTSIGGCEVSPALPVLFSSGRDRLRDSELLRRRPRIS
jgi:hypothetical protein